VIKRIEKEKIHVVRGEKDRSHCEGKGIQTKRDDPGILDAIKRFPEVFSFKAGEKTGVVFYGRYLLSIEDFSDFEPFALEMNMICNLTDLMQDDTVFGALKAMIPQFTAQMIIFAERKTWHHWQIDGVDIISIGKSHDAGKIAWGILENVNGKMHFEVVRGDEDLERNNDAKDSCGCPSH
jgi:hypothetical protein